MKVIKRDGTEVPFNVQKITDAIMAANDKEHGQDRAGIDRIAQIAVIIEARCESLARAVSVEEIQDMVVDELDKTGVGVPLSARPDAKAEQHGRKSPVAPAA